jgi:translation initiation factor 1
MKELLKNLAYSTNKELMKEASEEQNPTLEAEQQPLKVQISSKHRAGKTVTLVLGFAGSDENLEALAKKLKTACGTGGSAKDGEIIIQGDHKKKVVEWLQKNNYKKAKGI